MNGNSSSFIPSPSSESVDKCDIVDAIDVDVLDRNEEGDEEEDADDGVDGVLGDDGDIEEEDGEAYGGVPTAPTLPEATLLLEAEDEAGDEEGQRRLGPVQSCLDPDNLLLSSTKFPRFHNLQRVVVHSSISFPNPQEYERLIRSYCV